MWLCASRAYVRFFGQINDAAAVIYGEVDPKANIIFGALVDERMEGRMSITVLATGFQTKVCWFYIYIYIHVKQSKQVYTALCGHVSFFLLRSDPFQTKIQPECLHCTNVAVWCFDAFLYTGHYACFLVFFPTYTWY